MDSMLAVDGMVFNAFSSPASISEIAGSWGGEKTRLLTFLICFSNKKKGQGLWRSWADLGEKAASLGDMEWKKEKEMMWTVKKDRKGRKESNVLPFIGKKEREWMNVQISFFFSLFFFCFDLTAGIRAPRSRLLLVTYRIWLRTHEHGSWKFECLKTKRR